MPPNVELYVQSLKHQAGHESIIGNSSARKIEIQHQGFDVWIRRPDPHNLCSHEVIRRRVKALVFICMKTRVSKSIISHSVGT